MAEGQYFQDGFNERAACSSAAFVLGVNPDQYRPCDLVAIAFVQGHTELLEEGGSLYPVVCAQKEATLAAEIKAFTEPHDLDDLGAVAAQWALLQEVHDEILPTAFRLEARNKIHALRVAGDEAMAQLFERLYPNA